MDPTQTRNVELNFFPAVFYVIPLLQFPSLTIKHKFSLADALSHRRKTRGQERGLKGVNHFSSPPLIYLWWQQLFRQLLAGLSCPWSGRLRWSRTRWHGWGPLCKSSAGTDRWRRQRLWRNGGTANYIVKNTSSIKILIVMTPNHIVNRKRMSTYHLWDNLFCTSLASWWQKQTSHL